MNQHDWTIEIDFFNALAELCKASELYHTAKIEAGIWYDHQGIVPMWLWIASELYEYAIAVESTGDADILDANGDCVNRINTNGMSGNQIIKHIIEGPAK